MQSITLLRPKAGFQRFGAYASDSWIEAAFSTGFPQAEGQKWSTFRCSMQITDYGTLASILGAENLKASSSQLVNPSFERDRPQGRSDEANTNTSSAVSTVSTFASHAAAVLAASDELIDPSFEHDALHEATLHLFLPHSPRN